MADSTKAALIILDGWGLGTQADRDAIQQAPTPFFDQIMAHYPHNTLVTYGGQVGLPEGQMGNSEVGHLNIGAGRIVYQDFARINKAIDDGEFNNHPMLESAFGLAKERGSRVHIFGLLSDGGVHSHTGHVRALLSSAASQGVEEVLVHAFLDGRDTDPNAGLKYVRDLEAYMKGGPGKIATVVGRYFAMDRDNRWERIKVAYDLLVKGIGLATTDVAQEIEKAYATGLTDEFMHALLATDENGNAIGLLNDGDVAICFNFRTDRPRQITQVLTQEDMPEHDMTALDLHYVTMTRYDSSFKNIHVLFDKDNLKDTIGEVLASLGKTQLRIAETEKYPHVTYFLSGGQEEPFEGESRIVVPSPKVATYDLEPSMSAKQVMQETIAHVNKHHPDFICINFANADMVGHTGDFAAAKKACSAVDNCLSELVPLLLDENYRILIIADHGNSDFMINDDGSPHTAHTTNLVPCVYIASNHMHRKISAGKLADVAPTLLTMMGLPIPTAMTGDILISKQ